MDTQSWFLPSFTPFCKCSINVHLSKSKRNLAAKNVHLSPSLFMQMAPYMNMIHVTQQILLLAMGPQDQQALSKKNVPI